MSEPIIDVLIPVFNAAATVRSAIASIQRQTVADIRIIVVDDGSTDKTPDILADIAGADPRVLVITKPNGGIVEALNTGLGHCVAPFIARHDADDIAYPHRFAVQLDYMQRHPEVTAVGCDARHIDERDQLLGTVAQMGSPDKADPEAIPAREPYLLHPFLMVRKLSIEAVGGYRYVYHAEDADLYWRMQEQGRLHNMSIYLGDYRIHGKSISGASIRNGRVMAVSSQLSALSAIRRRAGKRDIDFPQYKLRSFHAASLSLTNLFDLASADLDDAERARLHISTSAKLLELAAYRPYEIELEDCRFLRSALDTRLADLPRSDSFRVRRFYSGTASRLAHKGRFREAAILIPPRLYLATVLRLAMRVMLPPAVRSAVKIRTRRLLGTSRPQRQAA